MIKRLLDIVISLIGLICFFPILLFVSILVWSNDKKSPFYVPSRVGKKGKIFYMVKLRSMVVNADKAGIDSTSNNDLRITSIGQKIRKYKLDELTQLWNVLKGDMSLVGPRPNVKTEVDLYTDVEKELLSAKPGITDFSSIVFSDEGKILENKEDPDLAYNQLIRPWKSRLGLIYIKHQSITLDIEIIIYTLLALISKRTALNWVSKKLENFGVDKDLVNISKREIELFPYPPPGSDFVISSRKKNK
jgi:lipopolysaccharide/colanic/teichoic acid biosynthesis glycosyltransferase